MTGPASLGNWALLGIWLFSIMDKERKLIIAGNWKMNKTVAEALDLVCE
jgi:hypothetical protein